jgi:hypothetical protein
VYISYSGHKAYRDCPRQYWHRYVGKTKLATPDNRVNALYGSTVGTLFEAFYNERIWMRKGVQELLEAMVDPTLDGIIRRESETGIFDWTDKRANYKSREAVRREVMKAIPRGMAIVRHHRLLGQPADAEVKLDSLIEGHMIGGRADFIMRRVKPHGDLIILDGKGSRHREKYVDPHQLWWYAMLHRHKLGHAPDRLGFLFWRQEPETSIDWVDFDSRSLDDLCAGVLDSVQSIEAGRKALDAAGEVDGAVLAATFPARPGDKCSLCAYRPACADGEAFLTRKFDPDQGGLGVEDV